MPFNETKYTLFELLFSVLLSITILSSFSRAGWAPAIEIMIITCLFCFLCVTESFGCLNWRHYINLRLLLLKKKGVKKKKHKIISINMIVIFDSPYSNWDVTAQLYYVIILFNLIFQHTLQPNIIKSLFRKH